MRSTRNLCRWASASLYGYVRRSPITVQLRLQSRRSIPGSLQLYFANIELDIARRHAAPTLVQFVRFWRSYCGMACGNRKWLSLVVSGVVKLRIRFGRVLHVCLAGDRMLPRASRLCLLQSSLAILLLSVTPRPLWTQEDNPALRERFLKGVAETGAKLEHLSYRAQFHYVLSAEGKDAPLKSFTRKDEVAIRGACTLETGVKEESGNVFFRVRNHDYAFALQRTPQDHQGNLLALEQIGVDPKVDEGLARVEETPRAFALMGYYLWDDPLFRVVQSDLFRIKRAYAITSEDKELVRVEFEYRINDAVRRRDYEITDGYLVCDPTREWALTEYGGKQHNVANREATVKSAVLEYGETIGGIPIATRTALRIESLDRDYRSEAALTAEIISRDVPEEEFYLTHYGLPEPNFNEGWFGAWVWCLIAGIVCLVASGMILKRRTAVA